MHSVPQRAARPRRAHGGIVTRAAALALLAVLLRPAHAAAQTDYYNTDAGRPLVVEDAYPVERRAIELQLAPLRFSRTAGRSALGVEPEIALGLLPRTQLEIGFPIAFRDAATAPGGAQLAGIAISAMHNLNVETTIPALAVAAELLLPAGPAAPARTYTSLKAIGTKTFSAARVHVNGEVTLGARDAASPGDAASDAGEAHEQSRWQAGIAVDRTFPLRSLLVSAELVARQPLAAGAAGEWHSAAGMRLQVSPRVAADAGLGMRLGGGERSWFATMGAAVAVGMPWRGRR